MQEWYIDEPEVLQQIVTQGYQIQQQGTPSSHWYLSDYPLARNASSGSLHAYGTHLSALPEEAFKQQETLKLDVILSLFPL